MNGKVIVFEGVDGSGKTSIAEKVVDALKAKGHDVILVREPGGTVMAEEIRHTMLKQRDEEVDGLTELCLVWAARRQLITTVIEPALKKGAWVVMDRFTKTTRAYQVKGRNVNSTLNHFLSAQVLALSDGKELKPDYEIFVDVDARVARERLAARPDKSDRLDKEGSDFKARVERSLRSEFYDLRLDGTLPFEVNVEKCLDFISKSSKTSNKQCQTYYQWRDQEHDDEGNTEWTTPHAKGPRTMYPFDDKFDSADEAEEAVSDSDVMLEERESWILVKVTEERVDPDVLSS